MEANFAKPFSHSLARAAALWAVQGNEVEAAYMATLAAREAAACKAWKTAYERACHRLFRILLDLIEAQINGVQT